MKKNILVTGVGGRSVGSGVLHALTRSTSASKGMWNVIAADADPFSWGLYKTDTNVILPYASAENYIERLIEIIGELKIDAVIPGTEVELETMSNSAIRLPVPIIANRKELIPLMMDKERMRQKLKELQLPFIPDYPIEQWETAGKEFGYPLVAKPSVGTGGSRGLAILLNDSDAAAYLKNADSQCKAIVQPYIGDFNSEYTVGVLSDKSGKLVDSIVMQRKLIGLSQLAARKHSNRTYAISTGYSQGYFIKDEQIQNFCETISSMIGSRGALNIQLRKQGDVIYIFEIHPRFSGTTPMRADVGFNEPEILLQNYLFDREFRRLNYLTDVAVIRAFEHVVVPISEMPRV
jgi:carbamoyl-phosphate synthase large subunit